MKGDEKALKRYYANVAGALLCGRKKKKAVLSELKETAGQYVSTHPDATPEELCRVFGTPEEIAASALQGEDLAALKRKTVLRRAVLIVLIAAVLIWAAFAVVSFIDVHTEAHGYFEEGFLAIAERGLPL